MYFIRKCIALIFGSTLLAIGINLLLAPYEILDGGIIGLALILNYLFHLKIGLMMIILSIPIFIIAWFKYRDYFYNSIHGLLLSSLLIDLFKPLRSINPLEPIPSAIVGGIFVGFGIGTMLRYKTSTGGTDLLAQFICDKTNINVGLLILIFDTIIIVLGGILLSPKTFVLSLIAIFFVGITTSIITRKPAISH